MLLLLLLLTGPCILILNFDSLINLKRYVNRTKICIFKSRPLFVVPRGIKMAEDRKKRRERYDLPLLFLDIISV